MAFKKELSQIEEHRKPLKPGEWGAGAFDIGKRVTFDGFADRPSPSKVSVKGVYLRQFREFSIDKQIGVQEKELRTFMREPEYTEGQLRERKL